jgi:hypothetical protein
MNNFNTEFESLDLGSIKTELALRQSEITKLKTDNNKLKTLLRKAKVALDSINDKFKKSSEENK